MDHTSFPTHLYDQRAVTAEYAMIHTDELINAVSKKNEAIFIRNDENLAVLVPYWWYMNNFGFNVRKIVELLFEECRKQDIVSAKINLDIAHGYLSHVNCLNVQEIQQCLMEKMDGHPYAQLWTDLLDRWSNSWEENHTKERWLVRTKFAGDRKIYLQYQNGTTRLLDGHQLIGKGLNEEDLTDDPTFYSRVTMTSGALLWISNTGRIQRVASSDELLELSTPVDPLQAWTIWNSQRIPRKVHHRRQTP